MIPNLVQLLAGRPPPELAHQAFIEDVHVEGEVRREARVERLILICWVLIAIKHVAIIWAVHHYPVPFHQLWVNFPTWLLGVLATGLYYGRTRRA
jgi:hypothetical protein